MTEKEIPPLLSSHTSRRSFIADLARASGVLVAPWVTSGLRAQSPNSVVHHASFGAAGMAMSDLKSIMKHHAVKVVAACDVDIKRTLDFQKLFPEARIYRDYREMLEKEKDLQSVNVSTPDHMHAIQAVSAMKRGIAVYGQKPLTHDLFECRRVMEIARDRKLVTQMGIQVHSSADYRTSKALIQAGAIGKIMEVHTFCGKAWGDAGAKPDRVDPVPENLDWNLWLGVCEDRPFIGEGWYHPSNWRKRLDFGTGTFGDMGCHVFDPVFTALELGAATSVRSVGPAPNTHSWGLDAEIHYVFPGTRFTEGSQLKVVWYDGAKRPPEGIQGLVLDESAGVKLPSCGSIFIGTAGTMLLPHASGKMRIVGGNPTAAAPVEAVNHWHQFIDAVRGEGKTSAHFGYAAPLTEAVLLGGVASRFPNEDLKWDSAALRFDKTEANAFVKRTYRSGWETPEFA